MFDVGVPALDENVEAGWWRIEKVGKPSQDDTHAIEFPNLQNEATPAPAKEDGEDDEVGIPLLVEEISDDDDDDEGGDQGVGNDDLWGPKNDALVMPVYGGPPAHVDGEGV